MTAAPAKYRFLLIQAFQLPPDSRYRHGMRGGTKEQQLMNYESIKHLLADVDWDHHPGALTTYGDWPVENQEEFSHSATARLPLVKEACASGKYNAIVLLGGGEPGLHPSREIGRRYNIPVVGCAHSQMHVATLLGTRFSVIDLAENHSSYYAGLIRQHGYADRCASIRNLHLPHARPGLDAAINLYVQKEEVLAKGTSEMFEMAVDNAVKAIEEDGAEVFILGCSALYWMAPYLEKRLNEIGWEVPVLEGYRCAIGLAKLLVDLGQSVSGLAYPGDRPQKWRHKKFV
jgi:allantoin racemase